MAEYTENYNLKKPAQEDFYNVDDFNNNADVIDSQLKTLSDGLGSAAQESTVSGINTKIGETGNTGGSATAGSVFAKLNKLITDITTHMGRWTSARAGYIDTINSNAASAKTAAANAQNYTATNNTASKTGILSQKGSYIISLLENAAYGLNALKTAVSSSNAGIRPSLTGTGTTVYNNTARIAGYIDSYRCIAKFIAPVSGVYNVTITANAQTNSGTVYVKKIISIAEVYAYSDNGSTTTQGIAIDQTKSYNISTVGSDSSACVDGETVSWGKDINTRDDGYSGSGSKLFALMPYIDYFSTSTTSPITSTSTIYCKEGEPVQLVMTGYSNNKPVYIDKVAVTYQAR